MMGKWLEIACFRTSVFPIIPVFPRFSRKKNRATFSPESEPYPFSTVEPGVWRRNFPGVLAYKFWWSELLQGHTAGTNFDLAVGNMQMNFDFSTGQ